MVHDISYNTINDVLESWEALRQKHNHEEVAGVKLFQKLFQKCPQAKALFGFPVDIDSESEEILKSKRFRMQSVYLIQMIDTAMNLLGHDIELLTEIMLDLGVKHVRYGVKVEMFAIMGESLFETLHEVLGDDVFTCSVRDSWVETYDALSKDMKQAQFRQSKQKQ